ncbi:LysR family transcriptional regulator [Hypericibacter adhaerens]|uniref:LysR family transcriptional regulator n=1 Tax=Hypericibacter adhaerens TaxID=2602016 RepID=UPI002D7F9452|nr:LysR family transcriptional regulator [Hypericibacter adhaerens]
MNLIDLPLRVLRYFVAVADAGNVTLAARGLHVSQPAVSLAIRQLETALGLDLFVRQHARGMALTPAGTEVLREVRELLGHINDVSTKLAGVGGDLRGTLSIGCLAYILARYLPAIISGFTARFPAIEVAFHEGDQSLLQRGMMEGWIELALTYDLQLPRRFAIERMLELPAYVLLPADHRLARRRVISLKALAEEPCVLLDMPISRDYFASVFGALGLTPQVRYRTQSVEAVRSLVANGLGYTVLNHPSRTLTTYDGKETRAVRLTDPLPVAPIAAVYLSDHKLRPVAQAFLDFMRGFFRREQRRRAAEPAA